MPSPLPPAAVHVWTVDPDADYPTEQLARYGALLCDAERERESRFVFARHRQQYRVSHALLRCVLSCYADVSPGAWRFAAKDGGRPEICAPSGAPPLRFNLTHTDGLAACAVSLGCEVGVDVEGLSRRIDARSIAARYFSAAERSTLERCEPHEYAERFFELWTLKEAYLKARGVGLAGSIDQCWFWIAPGEPIRLELQDPRVDDASSWQLELRRPTERHVLALAVRRGRSAPLRVELHSGIPL